MGNKRQDIIDAAIRRMACEGESFLTKDVADDVGCCQTLVFRYYDTKKGLISACFGQICGEIRSELETVPFPSIMHPDAILMYLMDVWEVYFDYLVSNRPKARVFILCTSLGYKPPPGCRLPKDVVRKALDDHYDKLVQRIPNISFISEYMIIVANAVATEMSADIDRRMNDELKEMILNGIASQLPDYYLD